MNSTTSRRTRVRDWRTTGWLNALNALLRALEPLRVRIHASRAAQPNYQPAHLPRLATDTFNPSQAYPSIEARLLKRSTFMTMAGDTDRR